MKKKKTFLIKFAKNILTALKIRHVRLYGHKFSNKIYTLLLPDFAPLLEFLGLARIPHFTTLQKVSQRLKASIVDGIILAFARKAMFRAGIDSTGMSLQHSTYYYEKRLEHFRKSKKKKPGRPRKRRRRKHQYTRLFADLDKQIILAVKSLRGKKSDCKMMKPTINKAKKVFDRIKSNDADKGYDAEYNHEFTCEAMEAEDFIKLRNKDVPVRKTNGTYRKKVKRRIHNKVGRLRKNHRNKIESMIFVVKKVFGEHLTAIKAVNQRQQLRFRIIAYNAYRKATSYIFLGFLRGLSLEKYI